MKPGRRAVEMTGAWKTKENQTQVSLRFPQPLEIATRFPHSHRPYDFCISNLQNQIQERRPWRRIASLSPSGSFFNEKMLPQCFAGRHITGDQCGEGQHQRNSREC